MSDYVQKISNNVQKTYDRVLKESVPGIATTDDKFILDNGFYVTEDESVFIKSTNETGKFFTKIKYEGEISLSSSSKKDE